MSNINFLRHICVFVFFSSVACVGSAGSKNPDAAKHTFVLVHGSTGGGWDWKVVGEQLEEHGHSAHRVTLTGLGERKHLATKMEIGLSTHIEDVVKTIIYEQLNDVVLVGHSYGGMVISGVMNQIPERIKHTIFLDAAVPDHGMSAIDVYNLKQSELNVIDGLIHFSWLDPQSIPPNDVPQPLNTYIEKVSFDNPKAKEINTSFVAFVPDGVTKEQRAEDPSWGRAERRGWTIRTFDGDHVVYRIKPAEFASLLIAATQDKNKS